MHLFLRTIINVYRSKFIGCLYSILAGNEQETRSRALKIEETVGRCPLREWRNGPPSSQETPGGSGRPPRPTRTVQQSESEVCSSNYGILYHSKESTLVSISFSQYNNLIYVCNSVSTFALLVYLHLTIFANCKCHVVTSDFT